MKNFIFYFIHYFLYYNSLKVFILQSVKKKSICFSYLCTKRNNMKLLLIPILTFLLFTNVGISQESYTPSQMQSFVDIYMEAKNTKSLVSFDKITIDKLAESDISYARYKEIFRSNLEGKESVLKDNEKAFFDELQVLEAKYKKDQKVQLQDTCEKRSFNYKTYTEIRDKYKTDINFQKSLKPYFDKYLNGQK